MNEINVTVREEGDSHRILSIRVAGSKMQREREKIIKRFQKKAKIPGFRPGRIPKQIIEKNFQDDIKLELMETVIKDAYREALKEQDLNPISQPRFSNVETSPDSTMSFDATFDVKPNVEVRRYTGFKIEKKVSTVSDSETERVLERLRRERAVSSPVDRPAQTGDLVSMSYISLNEDGTPIKDEPTKSIDVNLGDGGVLNEIENGIIGMSPTEEKEITVTYPGDYFVESLRRATRKLIITVSEVKEVVLPPLDDEFAKSIDPGKDLESLREEIKTRLTEEKVRKAERDVTEKLIDLVIEANPFESPKIIVEGYLDEFLHRLAEERKAAGQDFDPEKVRDAYRPAAERVF